MKTKAVSNAKKIAIISLLLYGISALMLSAFAEEDSKKEPRGDFVRGATVWANACVRCHNMRDPKELTDKQWKPVVSHMRLRAGLTGQDTRDVLAFLQQSNGDEK